MGTLVHTGLGSSYLIANVVHYPLANSFTIGTAEINNNNLEKVDLNFHFLVKLVWFVNLMGSWFRLFGPTIIIKIKKHRNPLQQKKIIEDQENILSLPGLFPLSVRVTMTHWQITQAEIEA